MKFGIKIIKCTGLMTSGLHGAIFPMEDSVLNFLQPARDYQLLIDNGIKYLKSVFSSRILNDFSTNLEWENLNYVIIKIGPRSLPTG